MIDSVHELGLSFNQTFNPIWVETFDWSNEEHSIESYKLASDVISQFKERVFVCFSKSLLKGEYIVNPRLQDDLDQFSSLLFEDPKVDDTVENSLRDRLILNYQTLTKEVSFLIDSYRHFIINLSNKYRLDNHHYLVSAFSVLGRDESVSPLLQIFITHELFVYHLEHNFSRSEETIKRLIFTKHYLEKEREQYTDTIRIIIDLIIDRCHFLLVKLLYNEQKTEYLLDFERKVLPERTGDDAADSFLDVFKFYYKDSYSQDEEKIRPIQKKILKKQRLSFQEFVILFKYYKDSGIGTVKQFDNAIDDFESKYRSAYPTFGDRNYDVYASNTIKNYVYNCRLSFLLNQKKGSISFSELKKEMDSIIQLQTETGIFNFYPYRKAVKKLAKDIREYLHSNDYKEEVFIERFGALKDYYSRFCDAVKWCEDSSFFPILNLHHDSSRKNDELGIKVYYPSSFSRYVDYELLRKEIVDFDSEIRIIDSEWSIKHDFHSLENLKDDIEKSKRSFYEIFGVFTGLVAIVFGGISLFSERDVPSFNTVSLDEARQLMKYSITLKTLNFLSFGACILGLISLVYFISLPKEKSFGAYWKHPKFWAFLIMLVFALVALIVLFVRTPIMSVN